MFYIICTNTIVIISINNFQEQQIKIGKFNINYTKVGHGPHNVVMIPGALGSIRSHYQHQIMGFNREKFTLVIFDPQGYGKSVPPERILTKEGFQIDADIACELMKACIYFIFFKCFYRSYCALLYDKQSNIFFTSIILTVQCYCCHHNKMADYIFLKLPQIWVSNERASLE